VSTMKIFKYPEINRIPIPGFRIRGKHYLLPEEVEELLKGEVVVEEKLDGNTMAEEQEGYMIFGEYLKWVHSIHYTALPDWFVGFDVWDGEKFLPRREKEVVFDILGIPCVPLLFRGRIRSVDQLISFLGRPSAFGAPRIEGIVVKNYSTGKMGKIVDPRFEDQIDSSPHWRRKKRTLNILKPTS